jgi:hypothetical protein
VSLLLAVQSGGAVVLEGSASLVLVTSGLVTDIPLAGASALVLSGVGGLDTGILLVGPAALIINASGVLDTGIPLLGSADLVVLTLADLTGGASGGPRLFFGLGLSKIIGG